MDRVAPSVSVACRIRPRVARADLETGKDALQVNAGNTVQVIEGVSNRDYAAVFDNVFGPASSQSDVFDSMAGPLVRGVVDGYNGTVFAYGQTGSGKTHTMQGTAADPGLTPRAVAALFDAIADTDGSLEFTIRCSYLEIYMERVRDLLNPSNVNLPIREEKASNAVGNQGRGVFVEGASEEFVGSQEELMRLIRVGEANRNVGSTGMNAASSRSHSVVLITVEARDLVQGGTRQARLSLVDLAGSEQVARTGAEGQQLDEARMINKSLFTLSKCISTLAAAAEAASNSSSADGGAADGGSTVDSASVSGSGAAARRAPQHIPYRDSKLTRLLQESLGGNARTALIVCCSPCSSNLSESLSTLRFGQQAKKMRNKPVINKRRTVEEMERLLAKAEYAIDEQMKVISILQQQLMSVVAAGGALLGSAATEAEATDDAASSLPSTATATAAASTSNSGNPAPRQLAVLDIDADSGSGEGAGAGAGDNVDADGSEGVWGDPASWTAASPVKPSRPPQPPQAQPLSPLSPLSPASPAAAAAAVAAAAGGLPAAVLSELSDMRDTLQKLRAREAGEAEELAALKEEIKALQAEVDARDAAAERAAAEREAALAAARDAGAAAALAAALTTIRGCTCSVCGKQPYAALQDDVSGVGVMHEAVCFEAAQARAHAARLEDRAVALQTELSDVKGLLDAYKVDKLKAEAAAAASGAAAAAAAAAAEAGRTPKAPPSPTSTAAASATAAAAAAASPGASTPGASSLPVMVEARVARELQSQLANLVHVHRQLLRKYAVVDVEAEDMAEALRGRDARIAELNSMLLAQSQALVSLRGEAEARVERSRREGDAALAAVRDDCEAKLEALRSFYEHRLLRDRERDRGGSSAAYGGGLSAGGSGGGVTASAGGRPPSSAGAGGIASVRSPTAMATASQRAFGGTPVAAASASSSSSHSHSQSQSQLPPVGPVGRVVKPLRGHKTPNAVPIVRRFADSDSEAEIN